MKFRVTRSLVLVSGLALSFAPGCGSTESASDSAASSVVASAVVEPAEAVEEELLTETVAPVVEEPVAAAPVVQEPVPEVAPTPALDRVQIVRVLEKGDLRRFRLVESEESEINMGMQGSMTNTRHSTTEWAFEVLDVDSMGKATLEVKMGRVRGALENPMLGEIDFDSAAESADTGNPMLDMMVKAFTALGGKTFRATLGAEGDLSGFKGLQELLDEANAGMGGGMGMGMGGGLTVASVTKSLNEALVEVPAGFHAVGDTWDRVSEAAGAMGRTSTVTVKAALKSITAEDVTIETKGTIELSAPTETDDNDSGDMQAAMMREMMKGMKMVESAVASTVRVGRSDGFVMSRVTETNVVIEMASPMGGDDKLVVKTKNKSELSRVTAN